MKKIPRFGSFFFSALACHACISSHKETKSEQSFQYDLTENGCATGNHSAASQDELCKMLKDDLINKGCALVSRQELYSSDGCKPAWPAAGTVADTGNNKVPAGNSENGRGSGSSSGSGTAANTTPETSGTAFAKPELTAGGFDALMLANWHVTYNLTGSGLPSTIDLNFAGNGTGARKEGTEGTSNGAIPAITETDYTFTYKLDAKSTPLHVVVTVKKITKKLEDELQAGDVFSCSYEIYSYLGSNDRMDFVCGERNDGRFPQNLSGFAQLSPEISFTRQ